jgi:hypothetical protein
MLYQNPAIQSRVEVHLVEEAKGGPSKLLLSFLFYFRHLDLLSLSRIVFERARLHCDSCALVNHLTSFDPQTVFGIYHPPA